MAYLPKIGYRKAVKTTAAYLADPRHPAKHGVDMQAHHLVSRDGVSKARKLKALHGLGYDINDTKNLVMIPCTLPGACHLRCQLHRGDHTHSVTDYEDDDHPTAYHKKVKQRLIALWTKRVNGRSFKDIGCHKGRRWVQGRVNVLSRSMLKDINNFRIPLTSIYEYFKSGEPGCCNATSIAAAKGKPCKRDRNHQNHSGIQLEPRSRKYSLRAGR